MKSMQEAIPTEVGAIRTRTIKSYGMGRIDKGSCDSIILLCDQIEGIVLALPKEGESDDDSQ
jgi:hypothetical protein